MQEPTEFKQPALEQPTTLPGQPAAFDANRVDRTLIRWMLSLTPAERLQVLQQFVNFVSTARDFRR